MHGDGFYVTGDLWAKFSAKYSCVSYDMFWDYKLQKYEACNAAMKQFFRAFIRDRIEHHRVLRRRAMPLGLAMPKEEPIEEGEIGPPSYTCKGSSPF